jgi:DNA-binding MarR family transcriptional regulator
VAKNVRLTARGAVVTADAERRWAALHEGFLKKFGPEKLAELNEFLAAVREHFKN